MAEGDGAAVDVHSLRVELELSHASDCLGGKRLVELDEVEIADLDPCPPEGFAGGRDRSHSHDVRVHPGNS